MRREGYEFQVSKPEVIYRKDPDTGELLEPFEEVHVEVADQSAGTVVEMLGARRFDPLLAEKLDDSTLRFEPPEQVALDRVETEMPLQQLLLLVDPRRVGVAGREQRRAIGGATQRVQQIVESQAGALGGQPHRAGVAGETTCLVPSRPRSQHRNTRAAQCADDAKAVDPQTEHHRPRSSRLHVRSRAHCTR